MRAAAIIFAWWFVGFACVSYLDYKNRLQEDVYLMTWGDVVKNAAFGLAGGIVPVVWGIMEIAGSGVLEKPVFKRPKRIVLDPTNGGDRVVD